MGSTRETPEIQICRVVLKGLQVTLQMPSSATFARVVFLSSEGTFVFELLELKALSIQMTRLQLRALSRLRISDFTQNF